MSGQEFKAKMAKLGYGASVIADKLGITPQALNTIFKVADLKTGFLEKVCKTMDIDIAYFYPTSGVIENTYVNAGDGSAVATNQSNATAGADPAIINRLLDELQQERELNRKLVEKLIP